MHFLLLAGLLHAQEPAPAVPPAPGSSVPTAPAPEPPPRNEPGAEPAAEPGSQPPPVGARVAGEEIDVIRSEEVLRKRAELYEALVHEGYVRRLRRDDRTVFLSETPWKPRVIVHDDGWVYFRREPPRLHAPGKSFSDQGTPASYLLCIIMPTACVSVGGWVVSPRKKDAVESALVDSTRDKVRALNDAVARRELGARLNQDIPRDLEAIWTRSELAPEHRRVLLFAYWDTRTDTPEGRAAKGAVEAFLRGVVQQSNTPFAADELAALNAGRESIDPLDLSPRVLEP